MLQPKKTIHARDAVDGVDCLSISNMLKVQVRIEYMTDSQLGKLKTMPGVEVLFGHISHYNMLLCGS